MQVHIIQFNERVAVVNNVVTHDFIDGIFMCHDAEGKPLYWQSASNIQAIVWQYNEEEVDE